MLPALIAERGAVWELVVGDGTTTGVSVLAGDSELWAGGAGGGTTFDGAGGGEGECSGNGGCCRLSAFPGNGAVKLEGGLGNSEIEEGGWSGRCATSPVTGWSMLSALSWASSGAPGVGVRPSFNALAISAAFHFAYLILASTYSAKI